MARARACSNLYSISGFQVKLKLTLDLFSFIKLFLDIRHPITQTSNFLMKESFFRRSSSRNVGLYDVPTNMEKGFNLIFEQFFENI